MRIVGMKAEDAVTGKVVIPRGEDAIPVVLTVQGLPLGTEERLGKMFPVPRPPKNRVPKGKIPKGAAPLYHFDDGKTVLMEDRDDVDFKEAESRHNKITAAYFVYQGLGGSRGKIDEKVSFEAEYPKEETTDTLSAFYLAIYEELKTSGLRTGDVGLIMNKVMSLSNLDRKKVEEIGNDFLSSQTPAKSE